MNSVVEKCNAKINIALDVIGKRADGYHNVELIFKEISLFDTVKVSLTDSGVIRLNCDDTSLPSDDGNIAYRAAAAILEEAGSDRGAEIELIKRIPHGAGLAGGSADAAGVLRAVNKLLGEPFTQDKLREIGAKLGADVPFCISGGCALAEGIGDILTPLPDFSGFAYVIVKPEASVSTKWVYENLDLSMRPKMNVKAAADWIRRGDFKAVFENSANILESVTAKKFPVIDEIKNCLREHGAKLSLMSGSGTAVFGMFRDRERAEEAARAASGLCPTVYIV